jgi:glutamate-1-semialdehyde 2,1-aminomutase
MVIFPFNDIERTIKLLDQNADDIACVLIDPVPHRVGLFPAANAFVEAIYKWTRKNNALLVFDEVVSFRVNYAGAQDSYTVKPDLTALGKIIGGGFPVGALAGKSEIMKVLDPRATFLKHPHSGTFSANPVSTTAGRIALELFDEKAVLKLNSFAMTARKQIEEVIKVADIAACTTGAGSMFRIHFQETAPTTYRSAYQNAETKAVVDEVLDYLFIKEEIIMINTLACMLSTTLTQDHLDRLSDALLKGFKLVKPKLDKLR